MPGKVLKWRHGGSVHGLHFDCDFGITDGSDVTVVTPLLSIGDDDPLAHQRVDRVVCG